MFEYLLGGAGSHKTTRLCEKALAFLKTPDGHPSRLVLTTYAREAANQLLDRVRSLVLRDGALSWKEKQEIVTGLDAATIGTNHSLGRAAMEQHWLELGKTPAADVIDETTRRDFIAAAIGSIPLAPAQRQQLDALALRLGRSETEQRAPRDPKEIVTDDIRALVDMISDLGVTGQQFVQDCMTSVNVLCDALDRRRSAICFAGTLQDFIVHATQAAAALAAHPKGNTGATRDARETIEAFLAEPTWPRLDPLVEVTALARPTRAEPITPDAAIVEPLRQAARNYHLFPEFAADLRAYVETIATIASHVHQEYRRLVAETNRVDFADMEQALRDLLADPIRRKAFCSRFGYIGSDESQDMTARTAEAFKLVTQEVGAGAWLADPNQSIYPFRGADHEAVHQAAINLLSTLTPGAGATTHGLNHRSPPGIIRFVNDLFHSLSLTAGPQAAADTQAVRSLPLPHAQEAPAVAKTPQAFPGRIERWSLTEGSIEKRFAQLADGVERLINRPDGPIAPEEICIMVRTNASKKKAAAALAARGIKAAMRSTTLFESREARIIFAALGLIVDDGDTLAEATLRYLLDEQLPGAAANADFHAWLLEKIEARAAKQNATEPGGNRVPSPAWKEALQAARAARATAALSPVSAVLLAIEATGVIGRIAAWGDSFERQTHIDSVIGLARNYEKRSKAAGRPATVAGFLAMCRERADQEAREASGGFSSRGGHDDVDSDTPPKDHRGVRIMTCHATKGLGYRVTIVADFKLPGRGLSPFEIMTLDRKPHVWPNPLKGRVNDVLDQIARSLPDGRKRLHKKLEAESQLLYVAFTRSEGELVVAHATKDEDTNWLPTVFGPSNPAAGSPAGIDHFLPMDAAANQVIHTQPDPLPTPLTAVADYAYVDDLAMTGPGHAAAAGAGPTSVQAIDFASPQPITSVSHAPRYRSPSDYQLTAGPWLAGGTFMAIPLAGGAQPDLVTGGFKKAAASKADALGEAFHSFMAAIPSLPSLTAGDDATQKKTRSLWEKVAARCLGGFLDPQEIAEIAAAGLPPAVMVDRGQAFVDWCAMEFGITPTDWIVEAGVSGPANAAVGGTWRGRTDLVFVARSGVLAGRRVLVDHKAVMTTRPDCVKKTNEYLGEVTAYAEALDAPGPQSLAPEAIFIHFPLAAAVVPLVTAPRQPCAAASAMPRRPHRDGLI